MKFKDEEILKARRAIEKEAERKHSEDNINKELEESIFDGVIHIYEEEVQFERRRNEEYGISMMMPAASFEVDEELKKLLYPMDKRPKYVYGNESVNITVSFNYTEHKISEEQLDMFLSYSEKLLRSAGPKVMHVKKQMCQRDGYKMAVMEFASAAVDTKVYNIVFYVSIKGKLLMGTIYFPLELKKRQIKIAKEMLDSFAIEK